MPTTVPPTAGTTVFAVLVMAMLVRLAARARAFSALGLVGGGLVALLPLASSIAHTRLLVLPALGMSALIGVALDHSISSMSGASGIKRVWLGAAVALMGCLRGLDAQAGAAGVGLSTTRAVVLGCEAILVLDAFWALVLL